MQTKAYLGGVGLLLLSLPTSALASPLNQTISSNLSYHQSQLSFLTNFQVKLNQTQGLLDPSSAYPSLQITYQEWLATSQAVTNLNKQINELKSQLAIKQTELAETLAKQSQLNDHLNSIKLQLQTLNMKKADLTKELNNIKQQLATGSEHSEELQARMADINTQLEQLTDQLTDLAKTQTDLEADLTELAPKLASLKEEVANMTTQLNQLISQLEQLKAKQAQLIVNFQSELANLISQEKATVTNLTNQLNSSQQRLASQQLDSRSLTLRTANRQTNVSLPPLSSKPFLASQPSYQPQVNHAPIPLAQHPTKKQAKKPSTSQAKGDGQLASYTAPRTKFTKKTKHKDGTTWLYSLLAAAFALFSVGFFYQRTRRD